MLYTPITIFSSQNLSPQSVPESLVTFLPTLALGFWACPSHLLTTNEVLGHLRLGPQRPLKLTLREELASFHRGSQVCLTRQEPLRVALGQLRSRSWVELSGSGLWGAGLELNAPLPLHSLSLNPQLTSWA